MNMARFKDLLRKALDKTKLVQVERMVHPSNAAPNTQKKWVKPESVQNSDAVLSHGNLLDKAHPALKNKPKSAVGQKTPTPAGNTETSKITPPKSWQKLMAKQKGKSTAGTQPPKTEQKPVPPEKQEPKAEAKPKPKKKPETAAGKKQEPNPEVEQTLPETPEPDTYAGSKPLPRPEVKPPINRADVNAIGKREMNAAQLGSVLASIRSDGDENALTDAVAENAREKNYVKLLNGITDKELLRKIVYTGIIPEDDGAAVFVSDKLYRHNKAMQESPPDYKRDHSINSRIGSISVTLSGWYNNVDAIRVKEALNQTGIAGADFVFRTTFPAESAMILGSMTKGNRQVLANSDTMWFRETDKTSPENLFHNVRTYFGSKGQSGSEAVHTLIEHIAQTEPSLAVECSEWLAEYDKIMTACGGDDERMNMALRNTFERVQDEFSAEEYNTIVGGVLKLYGASLSDGGDTVFDGDYTQISQEDGLRMTYSTTGSLERQAVISNVITAVTSAQYSETLMDGTDGAMKTSTKANISRNLKCVPVRSLEQFRDMQDYVTNTLDTANARETNPHYTQAQRCQIAGRAYDATEFFSKDPSPVLDLFRSIVSAPAALSDNAKHKDSTLPVAEYVRGMRGTPDTTEGIPDFGSDDLLGLRAMAFTRAGCSLESIMGDQYAKLKEEAEFPEEEKGGHLYDERKIVIRGAYRMKNSVQEDRFNERRKQDGNPKTMKVWHGTGYGAGSGIISEGFKIGGVHKASGSTLGEGAYVGKSSGKVIPYAATGCAYGSEIMELQYDGDGYSKGDYADGIIMTMKMSRGKVCRTAHSISGARGMNKNCGGDADVVILPAGHGYKGWEAVAADADLVCPDVIFDAGLRYKVGPAQMPSHYKNIYRLDEYGPKMGTKTNATGPHSLISHYISKLDGRSR